MRGVIGQRLTLAVAAASALAGAPAQSQTFAQAQALEPSGDWEYRQDAETCRARRAFGSDGSFLQLRSFGPGSAVEVTVGRPDLPREPFSARRVELGWDNDAMEREHLVVLGSSGGVPTATMHMAHRAANVLVKGRSDRTINGSTPLPTFAQTLRVKVPGAGAIALHSGALQGPLDRLAACEQALLSTWGWGADYGARVASGPQIIEGGNFVAAVVYPAGAVIGRVSGYLQLRLKVTAEGKVGECVPQSSPGTPRFGADTCKMALRKLRYTPARNQQGDAVDSFAQLAIVFAILD